jgi:MSHA biogenesis protein MshE
MYRKTAVISAFAEGVSVVLDKNNFNLEQLGDGLTASDVPVVKLLQSMFENAVRMKASDIHIEPEEKVCRIRQRVDGVLHEKIIKEKQLTQALILRLKLMAGLNVSEKRLPQDGRFSLKVANKIFDIRLATLPVQFGESMVMRLLNQSANLVNLNQLGMADNVLSHLQKTLALSSGLLLVTGPTASGKTTTLYAALSELNSPSNKIITVEDPVEYRLPRINQVQVQPTIDFTFARALRSILRQDPNVIMIGELRDEETVEVALRAAMTGHLVLSTLHTNDVISGVLRLLDMKAEKYLIASVLRTVIAQRLLRQICSGCIQDITLTQQEKMWLETVAGSAYAALSFKQGAGCDHCHFTGYKGQIGIFELLDFTPVLAELLSANDIHSFSEAVKKQETFRPLVLCGLDLAARGMTSLSEVMRMSGESLHAERYHAESIPVYD